MAQHPVEIGIDSISLNPDAVLKTTLSVLEVEGSWVGRRGPEVAPRCRVRQRERSTSLAR
jgi:hypothetical protein